ncbi:hypothetical protein F2P81_024982 [Scophthalmus maximus]|uniref:Uncharacterized protein n=1 Tax=Scophthalmus maximus TaxID=52904 RepID=A0A6A4RV25_SCOMX|nr:hypothetical protein F2P81_024982 [Scophthalmus maximus]
MQTAIDQAGLTVTESHRTTLMKRVIFHKGTMQRGYVYLGKDQRHRRQTKVMEENSCAEEKKITPTIGSRRSSTTGQFPMRRTSGYACRRIDAAFGQPINHTRCIQRKARYGKETK